MPPTLPTQPAGFPPNLQNNTDTLLCRNFVLYKGQEPNVRGLLQSPPTLPTQPAGFPNNSRPSSPNLQNYTGILLCRNFVLYEGQEPNVVRGLIQSSPATNIAHTAPLGFLIKIHWSNSDLLRKAITTFYTPVQK